MGMHYTVDISQTDLFETFRNCGLKPNEIKEYIRELISDLSEDDQLELLLDLMKEKKLLI